MSVIGCAYYDTIQLYTMYIPVLGFSDEEVCLQGSRNASQDWFGVSAQLMLMELYLAGSRCPQH